MYELRNKTIFMTGASSGLGLEAAVAALEQGAHVYALIRDPESAKLLTQRHKQLQGQWIGRLEFVEGDLNSFDALRRACEPLIAKKLMFHQLVFNAGIMNFEHKSSIDGIEQTLQVNLLSTVYLLSLLHQHIVPEQESRVIFTGSALHRGNIQFHDLQFKTRFSSYKSYSQSKLGVILLCRFLSTHQHLKPIQFYVQHPGMVRTNLGRSAGWLSKFIFLMMGKTPYKGSETLRFLMKESTLNLKSGGYYRNCTLSQSSKESYDMDLAKELFQKHVPELHPLLKHNILNDFH